MTDSQTLSTLGIWCIVEDHRRGIGSPMPDDPFGRQVAALIEARQPHQRIVLWTTASARPIYESAFGGDAVVVRPSPPPPFVPPPWAEFLRRDPFRGERIGQQPSSWFGRKGSLLLAYTAARTSLLSRLPRPVRLALLPLTILVTLLVKILSRVLYVLSALLAHPYRRVCRRLAGFAEAKIHALAPMPEPEIADPPTPDVADLWIAPSPLCSVPPSAPFVLIVPDASIYDSADRLDPAYVLNLDRHLRDKSTRALLVVSPSRISLDDVLRRRLRLPAARLRQYPVLPTSSQIPPDRTQPRGRYLVCPVPFTPEHNLETLLAALATVRRDAAYRDLSLVLVGTNESFESHLRLRATRAIHRLDPYVHFSSSASPTLLHGAVAVVLPGLFDESADLARESLRRGCPIVCSDIAAYRDLAKHIAAPRFAPRDSIALAGVLRDVVDQAAEIRDSQARRFVSFPVVKDSACEWPEIVAEADRLRRRGPESLYPIADAAPYRLALVLEHPMVGGAWELAREIVEGLAVVNRRRCLLDLRFIHHPDQPGVDSLPFAALDSLYEDARPGDVSMTREARALTVVDARELESLMGAVDRSTDRLAFFAEPDRESLLEHDAFFFLAGIFPAKLAPIRPYGVMVLDLVPFQLPHLFPPDVEERCQNGIRPTLEAADRIVAISEATANLLHEYCTIDRNRVVATPLCCETFRRLSHPVPPPGIDRPFLLNIAGNWPHKGADVVVAAFVELKARLGEACPMLVLAGSRTEEFVSDAPASSAYVAEVRRRIAEAGLVVGRDIAGLGLVSDDHAAWLYQHSICVINAALANNGSFCLNEGRYFGRPLITSDYPAVREQCDRFGLPARFFPVGDAATLCEQMAAALHDPVLIGEELEQERRRLESDEFSRERYVDRLYDHLVNLARLGRDQRREPRLSLTPATVRSLSRLAAEEAVGRQ